MAEIPGAQAELDRAADWLREQVLWLAERITPGRALRVFELRDPHIADWRPPIRYDRSISVSVVEDCPPTPTAARIAQLFTAFGWSASIAPVPRLEEVTAVTGHLGGFVVSVLVHSFHGVYRYEGHTPARPLFG